MSGPVGHERFEPDDLVGRDDDVSMLVSTLRPGHIVTVVGPPGVGKTRLAQAVAASAADGATYWADLTEDVGLSMTGAVARALQLTAVAEQDLSRQLIERLEQRPSLLILDNCEHAVDAVADFLEHVCVRCPETTVLVTSRERLGARREAVFAVDPLAVPDSAERDPESIADAAAVKLLIRRASQIRPGFRLGVGEAAAAARICRQVDGLPLSIELAASRLRALTVHQVADGLDDALTLLDRHGHRGGDRHRSVHAALDWSHRLLDAGEAQLFRRLAVFPATFTLDAAVAVAGTGAAPAPAAEVLDVLARLIDKSFLTVSYAEPLARYRLLFVIRQYAAGMLRAAGEEEQTVRAYRSHYAELVRRETARIGRAGEESALVRLDVELDNVDATVRHVAQGGPDETALELASGLWRFCYLRGHYRRGRDWLAALHPCADRVTAARPRAALLHGEGMLAFLQCDYDASGRAFDAALALFRTAGDEDGVAGCLLALAGLARERREYARATELYRDVLQTCAEEHPRHAARARNYQAFLAWLQGDAERAEQLGRRALTDLRALGDHEGTSWAWLNLGASRLLSGDHAGAGAALAESRRIAADIAFREGRAWNDHLQGLLALRLGQPATALLRSSLAGHRALGDRWRTASVLADLATAYVAEAPEAAARLFGRADAIWEEIGSGPAPYERESQEAAKATAAAALGEDGYAAAWGHGRTAQPDMTLDGEVSIPGSPGAVATIDRGAPALVRTVQAGGARTAASLHAGRSVPVPRPMLEILALGGGEVRRGAHRLAAADFGYAKPRELLFALACHRGLGKEQIGTRLWPSLEAGQLRNALHTALRDLRKALGDPARIVYADGRYALDLNREGCRLDIADFEAALASARASADRDASLRQYRRAADIYRGELLPELDAEWVRERRESLRQAFVVGVRDAGRLLAQRRDFAGAAAMFARAVEADPFLEAAHRELMACWTRAGEPARAVAHYRHLDQRLRDELGVTPAPETLRLYRRLVDERAP